METNTKERIIDIATRLIHLNGFNNTSVDEILKESGVGKGSFYYYFESKEALGQVILERHFKRFLEEVAGQAFRTHQDPVERIFALLDLVLEKQRARSCSGGCPMGNLAAEMSDLNEDFRRTLIKGFTGWQEKIEEALTEARAKKKLIETVDVKRLSQYLVAGMQGAILMGKVWREPAILVACFEEMKEHLRRYLR